MKEVKNSGKVVATTVNVAEWYFSRSQICMQRDTANPTGNTEDNFDNFFVPMHFKYNTLARNALAHSVAGLGGSVAGCVCAGMFDASCPITQQFFDNGRFDHEQTFVYLDKTSRGNEEAGRNASHGMSDLAVLLNRWYLLCGRDKMHFIYICDFKTFEYRNPRQKMPICTWILGEQGLGKSLLVGEWDGEQIYGCEEGAENYASCPDLKQRVCGITAIDNHLFTQKKLVVIHDACTRKVAQGGPLWEKLKTLCTDKRTVQNEYKAGAKSVIDISHNVFISNDMRAVDHLVLNDPGQRRHHVLVACDDYTKNGKFRELVDAENKEIVRIVKADDDRTCGMLGSEAQQQGEIKQMRLRREHAKVKYVHYFLHAGAPHPDFATEGGAFNVEKFPQVTNDIASLAKYNVSEVRKFVTAIANQPVDGITDLAGKRWLKPVVLQRFVQFCAASNGAVVDLENSEVYDDCQKMVKGNPELGAQHSNKIEALFRSEFARKEVIEVAGGKTKVV